ncbi:MAG: ABC transporter substrate-binding protein [Xanthobacteraceae bacterium]|nr:ABC transporter substrate-binding protein [Xanthobacteraceae bacterium]
MTRAIRTIAAVMLALAAAGTAASAQTKVRLAVGGQTALFYLPLTVTDRQGYFKDEGLDVAISDLAGGARALQALMGGSADVVTGSFDHTIQMHAKHQPLTAVVQLGRFPGFVLALVGPKAASYRGPADLKGMKIGVTAPGSSTHFMVLHMMAQAGLKPDDASYLSVGAGQTAIAAARRGEIDALVSVDPVINLLDSEKAIRIVADTRTIEGTRQVYGGLYPAAVLYLPPAYAQRNPATVQSLTNAFVRGLKWIASHPAEEIAKVMPPEHALGNMGLFVRSIRSSVPMYSPDGRLTADSAETALKVLREFDTNVRDAKIDLAATYTNAFIDKVPAR